MHNEIIAYHVRESGIRLPVVNDTCGICQRQAIASAPGVVACRVGGDSANGYETWHSACFEAEDAAWEAREAAREAARLAREAARLAQITTTRENAWRFANRLLDDGAARGVRGRALDHLRWLTIDLSVDEAARKVYRDILDIEDPADSQDWYDEYESRLS